MQVTLHYEAIVMQGCYSGGGSLLACLEEDDSNSFLAASTSSSLSSWMTVVLAFGLTGEPYIKPLRVNTAFTCSFRAKGRRCWWNRRNVLSSNTPRTPYSDATHFGGVTHALAINYDKLNALYDQFVPQKELSREQVYWLPAAEIASRSSTPAKPVAP
nr:hypothetical protein [Tanacetum cinerariifolium]